MFQKLRIHLKILGAESGTWSNFRTEDMKILGATVKIVVARNLCTPDFHYLPE
jgi:hypothetical protein